MKKELSDYTIIHNSGQDLWDYLFEGQSLKNFEEVEEDSPWFDEGIEWLMDELLDGEMYEHYEDNQMYVYTSMGRLGNIKRKAWKRVTLESNTIQGNVTGGAISVTKVVRNRWGIKLEYDKLPKEVTKNIHINRPKQERPEGSKKLGRPRKDTNG